MNTILEFLELYFAALVAGCKVLVACVLLFTPITLTVVFGNPWLMLGYLITLPSLYALGVMWGI